jgi:hypothetical protein
MRKLFSAIATITLVEPYSASAAKQNRPFCCANNTENNVAIFTATPRKHGVACTLLSGLSNPPVGCRSASSPRRAERSGYGNSQALRISRLRTLPIVAMLLAANINGAQAEEIALDCQLTLKSGRTYKAHIETDGASLTIRADDGNSASYTNSKGDDREEYLRVSPSEITYGTNYSIQGTLANLETVINRNTGEIISNRKVNLIIMPRMEVGQCEKAATAPKKF